MIKLIFFIVIMPFFLFKVINANNREDFSSIPNDFRFPPACGIPFSEDTGDTMAAQDLSRRDSNTHTAIIPNTDASARVPDAKAKEDTPPEKIIISNAEAFAALNSELNKTYQQLTTLQHENGALKRKNQTLKKYLHQVRKDLSDFEGIGYSPDLQDAQTDDDNDIGSSYVNHSSDSRKRLLSLNEEELLIKSLKKRLALAQQEHEDLLSENNRLQSIFKQEKECLKKAQSKCCGC